MQPSDIDFQSAHEIGKIYHSLMEKKVLADFFLESVLKFIDSSEGYLFIAGREGRVWLEARTGAGPQEASQEMIDAVSGVLEQGKSLMTGHELFIPLVVRNSSLGVALFRREPGQSPFTVRELDLATGMSSQLAGALKNILLFEDNLRMERLAAVGQTLATVIHEIKNIMQLAKLSHEFLERGLQQDNGQYVRLGCDKVGKALREMEGFTMDMLSLTKDYRIERTPLSWKKLLEELYGDLAEKAAAWKVRFDFQATEGFPEVDADSRVLYRALLNLVKNAIEASDKGNAFIRIRVRPLDESRYEVLVEDNGQGMSAETRARIFESFYSTKGRRGTGLGLMIAHKAVAMHQGQITVESERGKGTIFRIVLPMKISVVG